ncbi:Blue copper protein [Linum grandiflorum]
MGYHSKSVSHQDLMALILIIAAVALSTPTTILAHKYATFRVGGDKGWVIGTHYQEWVEGKQFHVGDQLVFKYEKGEHNVFEVTKSEYEQCIVPTDPSKKLETGNDAVMLNSKGGKYYLCGEPGHCAGGQKLAINVIG